LLKSRNIGAEKKKQIIFIGNIKKHKGLAVLLEAFLAARGEGLDYKLVIVGSKDNIRSHDDTIFGKLRRDDFTTVEFTGFISDETLVKLLAESSLLVQPSLYEGFCLPPLEAMTAGTMALISDIPVLKEIYQDYPVAWFKAGDPKDLKNNLMLILYNKKACPVNLTKEHIEKYSFRKTSRIILGELNRS
jgi:glycosyltransferase involved in cell wall biosynthesis